MRKQTILYTSPIDALMAVTKRLSIYESRQRMDSEEFRRSFLTGTAGANRPMTRCSSIGRTAIATTCNSVKGWRRAFLMLHEVLAAYLEEEADP